MYRKRSLSLRSRFVLILLFGAVLPLGLVGYWLAHSAERSGEELLRHRLAQSLQETIGDLGSRWASRRSELLDIAEHSTVQSLLRGPPSPGREMPTVSEVRALYAAQQDAVVQIDIRDTTGTVRLSFRQDSSYRAFAGYPKGAPLRVVLDLYAPATGERLGTLHADVRFTSLLEGAVEWGAAGGVLGAFDPASGFPLLPLTIDPTLFRQTRFAWGGEPWISVRHVLFEPPIELVLGAPLGLFAEPFAEAARRGTVALLLVAVVSFGLATLVTARLTGSLRRLATAVDTVSAGDLEQRVPETGGIEVGRVARAFNAMTENLQRTLRQLAQRESLSAVGEFAASLAHEVRNPLSSIRVDLQRAAETATDGKSAELVSRALRSVDRLDRTVTGALRVARSGRIAREHIDLGPVVRAAMHSAQPEFRRRDVRLEPWTGDEPLVVSGDPAALEQVFLNLLLNAAEAQDAGGRASITVRKDTGYVTVTVSDNGPGIPANERNRVTEPFYSTKQSGTGLGLSIVQRIVAAHAGDLAIESVPGKGTTVLVRLPAAERNGTAS